MLGDAELLLPRLVAAAPTDAASGEAGVAVDDETRFARQFTAEWIALLIGLVVLGALIGWSLFKAHAALDATERDRLRVQARVVDDNVGQQLDGMNRALASVRDEFLGDAGAQRLDPALGAPEGAERRDPGRALDGSARRRRQRSSRAASTRCSAATSPTATTSATRARPGRRCDPARRPAAARRRSAPTPSSSFARSARPNGAFAGAVAAALEPEYFKVLMRSVLYAPDMWVSLGHGDGKVFVTMPEDPRRIEGEAQPAIAAIGALRGDSGADADRDRRHRRLERAANDRARPDLAAVAGDGQAARHRRQPIPARSCSRRGESRRSPTSPSSRCSAPAPPSACIAASGGASRTRCSRRAPNANAARPPSSSSSRSRAPTWACGTGTSATIASTTTRWCGASSAIRPASSAIRARRGATSSIATTPSG